MIALNQPLAPDLRVLSGYLEKVQDSGWYTNFGPLHEELTQQLSHFLGVDNLLLVNNGTSALQVAAKVLGVRQALTTPFSFAATTSAFLWDGIDLSFSDIDAESLNMCPKTVLAHIGNGAACDAIVATHVYGNPCMVHDFEVISQAHKKTVIYDAAHCFGVTLSGRSILSYGDASTLSFHATKLFHTVEGGAIVFKSKEAYSEAKDLINFGIRSSGHIEGVGINAKLNEYQAAVGLTLLSQMPRVIESRALLFERYFKLLNDVVDFPCWQAEASFNGAYMPILLESESERARLSEYLSNAGIGSRAYFSPELSTVYPQVQMLSNHNAKSAASRVLCLPLHFYLTESDVDRVADVIKACLCR